MCRYSRGTVRVAPCGVERCVQPAASEVASLHGVGAGSGGLRWLRPGRCRRAAADGLRPSSAGALQGVCARARARVCVPRALPHSKLTRPGCEQRLHLSASGDATGASAGADRYSNLDAVWSDPKTSARVFIGNLTAAKSEDVLLSHGACARARVPRCSLCHACPRTKLRSLRGEQGSRT